ncbi:MULTISPECIES: CbiX/SirB N-terminal domain-containing protein [unclassified Halomonas]|uniref:sirohydrochlorin chelatase n=1 Tax=unclassified Halomonas TaxID=2609666 RepID=UPI000D39BB73|nr:MULTISPECIES: CbiX/SirB N-terminal domain-containing protein [unclassified Halomonas]MBR9772077.1 cobalamin biosynthesis protein CbiX [Gammaproteobacteria bacterium]MBY5942586.1 CbiX/SirB N-terminal domain-containing protein [Halomonas sp. DP5N14-9]MBY6112506.1 CbiX/SirB N-terminal domain-containing protein [Halomonas sp. DP1Y21-3]MCJ8287801.1 CbiX/SirB N-terminal domain-containing protein [Halomonas sp.]MCO7215858.1 CbiX/SirB N-terminal domain-containing protein [Halomonas sp. OfavH-34-E]
MSYALVLLAHGSSDPNWRAPFEHFRDALAPRLGTPIRLSYMELCEPSLESTVAELSAAGATRIEVLPLFFAAGRHLRKDVPAQIDALRSEHPGLELTLLAPVGEHPVFVEALASAVADQVGETLSPAP